ncbi:hypothetical protein Esti_006705 [Eimeria stiedai]
MALLFRGWDDAEHEGEEPTAGEASAAVYTELRLQGLITSETEMQRLLEICNRTADCRSFSSWRDTTLQTTAPQTGSLDMRKRSEAPREVKLRWYFEPAALKDTCVLYHKDSGGLLGSLAARREADATRVVAVQTTQAMRKFWHVAKRETGGDSDTLRERGREAERERKRKPRDRAHQRPLRADSSCWLVELHARRSNEAATAAAEAALVALAETLKPRSKGHGRGTSQGPTRSAHLKVSCSSSAKSSSKSSKNTAAAAARAAATAAKTAEAAASIKNSKCSSSKYSKSSGSRSSTSAAAP